MNRILLSCTLLATMLAMLPPDVRCEEPARPISLKEAISRAAEKNLDIRAELYNPAQYEADVNRNRAIYDPLLTLSGSYSDTTSQSATLTYLDNKFTNRNTTLNASLSQLLWTGGTAALQYNNNYYRNNSSNTLNNYWASSLEAVLTQPLLKNFGRESTDLAINISLLNKNASMEQLNSRLLAVIGQVRTEYFKLYSLKEQLEVKKVSLQLANKILADTKARVAAGVMPAMEISSAEFGAAAREKELIDAEKAVSDQVDVIRVLLQLDSKGDIATVDLPVQVKLSINEDDAIGMALQRPDIREQKRSLEIAELQTRVYRNRTLPDLSLSASGGLSGLDRTYPDDMNRIGKASYPAWSVGLTFTYPLGNNAAENDYRKSRLKSGQLLIRLRALEDAARNEVRSAIRGVAAGYKQIDVADRGRVYAEQRLNAYIRKNQVGLATIKEVLDVENDLANAKANQITAHVNYDNAVTRYWQVTGELLEREGIRFQEAEVDRLYKSSSR